MKGSAPQPVYLFDLEGNYIQDFPSAKKLADKLGTRQEHIHSTVSRKSCIGQKYYVSYNKNFVVPIKHTNFNPLFRSKGGSNMRYNYGIIEEI